MRSLSACFFDALHMQWERITCLLKGDSSSVAVHLNLEKRKRSPLPLNFNSLWGYIIIKNSRATVIRRSNETQSGHYHPNVHFKTLKGVYTRKKDTPNRTYTTSSINPSYQLVEPSWVIDLAINTATAMATSSIVVKTIFIVLPMK